ncbi:MAG TPA: HAMP domain-containing sensor histidine kinase [Thermoanaerobaculia bacterium]|nr:HAMP domain-containing sensor histidine kinase [Thermoanaerobaculia bacterium]
MKNPGREREGSRSGLVVALLLSSLVMTGALAWQAQTSTVYHRVAAEKVLRDYAMLTADEFARRTVNELGFYGFYPLVTAIRQEAAKGRLLSPTDLKTSGDENIRPAGDLVRSTFRYERASKRLETLGPEPTASERDWIAARLAPGAAAAPPERRYLTAHALVGGAVHSIVYGSAGPGSAAPLTGFEADPAALAARFRKVAARGPLFPASLVQRGVRNDALFLQVLDPSGREVFRSGVPRQPYLGVTRPFGEDYNGILSGFVIRAAVDPAAAPSLVIGGLPRSRLPFLLGALAVTMGLTLTAVRQLRRERVLTEMRSDFVSRVSHELRTPLTQIRMFAETLLLNRVRSEDERRRSLEIIDRESRRLTNLVENVLRFSRGERGEDRVEAMPRDVVPLLRQLLVDFEPLLSGRASIRTSLPDRAVALVDEAAFRQVLLNLLDNAVKYGPPGQEIRVSIESDSGEKVRIAVEDGGPGIPVRERDRVWRRFYRLARDRESAVAGTGIGLAVVRELTLLQGGRAYVEEGAGGGARFVVELEPARLDAGLPV